MPALKKAKKSSPTLESVPSDAAKSSNTGPQQATEDVGPANKAESKNDHEHQDTSKKEIDAKISSSSSSSNARGSWYGGTWPRTPAKAAPITHLAKESITSSADAVQSAKGTKSKAGSIKSLRKAPSLYMSPGVSTRSLPSTGTTSKISVSTPKLGHTESHDGTEADAPQSVEQSKSVARSEHDNDSQRQDNSDSMTTKNENGLADGTWGMASWLPTFGRGDAPPLKPLPAPLDALTEPQNSVTRSEAVKSGPQAAEAKEAEQETEKANETQEAAEETSSVEIPTRPRSWFGLWNGESSMKSPTTAQAQPEDPRPSVDTDLAIRAAAPQKTKALDAGDAEQTPEERAAATSAALADNQRTDQVDTRNVGWSWWNRQSLEQANAEEGVQEAESPSADKMAGPSTKDTEMTGTKEVSKPSPGSRKRGRPASSDLANVGREDKISKQSTNRKTSATAAVNVLPDNSSAKSKEKPVQREHDSSNLLLPSLKQTYRAAESPGLLGRLASYFFASKSEMPKHPSLIKEPAKIRHAIAIGVHGYFPAPLIRSVIGQPKGTSVRFATEAAKAIREWCQQHDCSPKIDKIVLEGEGKISERVELLWQLLIKQVELIRESDFILIACHSQGVPVAVQLVAKMIKVGMLSGKKVGICAMAGVNLGPFAEYKSRWISGSAGELFDFAAPDSQVSIDYEAALRLVLKRGIKVVLIGSIDDQLVSMESATFGSASHPCLFRAVFINGQVHAPTFVVHLVGFALKLRNLGVPDHGLIRELSNSLAGSFTGDGHSRLYEDAALYDLAIEFALETTACEGVDLKVTRTGSGQPSQNPYILPFAMRGVLEEQFVKSDLRDEMDELLSQFDEWKPATKGLRDVKFRLEGVRSKI